MKSKGKPILKPSLSRPSAPKPRASKPSASKPSASKRRLAAPIRSKQRFGKPIVPTTGKGRRLPVESKSADPTRDATPNTIDSPLERRVGKSNPTSVPGAGHYP